MSKALGEDEILDLLDPGYGSDRLEVVAKETTGAGKGPGGAVNQVREDDFENLVGKAVER